ncbi:MAG: PD-(D/E)XK nuclease family protein, partial [Opitutaceae bacterium]
MSSPSENIRRHFLSWERPWVERATAWLARGWNERGPLDLSSTLAIVPTRQAGRRLREALAEFAAARGSAVFAPRVLTPEALLKQDAAPDAASPLQTLLAWTEVFRALDLEAFREVFPVDPPVRNFPWALRLAQQFARLQVTLADAGLRLGEVVAAAGEEFVEQSRWKEIAELESLHGARLAEHGLRDPNAARIQAASNPMFERQFERIVVLA